MNENETGLIAFNQLPAIAEGANAVLAKNKGYYDKAKAKAEFLLDTIQGEGMNDELDAECNQFLANCGIAKEKMNAARAPITQLFTAIAKEFTTLENPFDKAKPGTFAFEVQEARNNYARQKEIAARKKEEELRKARAIEEEKISIKAKVETIVREKYATILYNFKKKYNDEFGDINTSEALELAKKSFMGIKIQYPRDKFLEIAVPVTSNYIQPADLAPMVYDAKAALYDELSANFTENMEALKHYLLEQLPARKFELEEIAKAGVKEKKRLEEEAKLRRQEEENRLERERLQKEKDDAELIRQNAEVNQAELSFKQDVAHAELRTDQGAVKYSYVIKVMTPIGYQQIAALWFKHFGGKTTLDKLEKKTLGAMKSDLEKMAFNGGERLSDSGNLVYESDVKAVTKRT